jgi:predicted nucleic acid-binding protein
VTVFLDTSALYAVLDRDDENHREAASRWRTLVERGELLVTSNYVVLELLALLQHRLGVGAVRALCDDMLGVVDVRFVAEPTHRTALGALLAARRRRLSLVDCASFELMRELGIERAFAFDRHFREQGFLGA